MAFSLSAHLVLHITLVLTIFQTNNFHLSQSSKPKGFSLKLIHRDSPESPLYPGNLTETERLERLIKFSNARANYLKYSVAPWTKPEDIQEEVFRDGFLFIIAVVLGVPPSTQFVLVDTGSNLLWVQCEPCVTCYRQTEPIYDSLNSFSYRKLPCSHFLCNGPGSPFQCVNDECVYSISYGDGAGPTKGVASAETFRFRLKDNTIRPLDGIVFGCSNDNVNMGYDDTAISGIIGLSMSPESLVTQLPDYVQGRFSYCLVPLAEGQAAGPSSFLTFGDAIPTRGSVHTTSFVKSPRSDNYYYYLNLLDISVGWDRIGFPADTFKVNQDGTGGILIDSGSVSSYLNSDDLPNGRKAYKEVLGAFQRFYDSLNLQRNFDQHTVPQFELCYNMPRGFNHFATLTYHFDKADYVVDGIFANYIRSEEGFFCVSLLGLSGMSILGAWHQQNKRIIYNSNIFSLQFTDELCQ